MHWRKAHLEGEGKDNQSRCERVRELGDISFTQQPGVGEAGKKDNGGGGRLNEEVLNSGFHRPRVMFLGYKWEDGKSVYFKPHPG